ncbi:hypothetical protein QBC41DRAFT_8262 [Cercophora samala]|uniref:Secreted protein n=1 Tax=Cercophora samala TaxID=330535 RepID=A0AA39Z958_9PEZI|nr:hypothetical protein QBC41DRAFT_8262 [Cercophora samala]
MKYLIMMLSRLVFLFFWFICKCFEADTHTHTYTHTCQTCHGFFFFGFSFCIGPSRSPPELSMNTSGADGQQMGETRRRRSFFFGSFSLVLSPVLELGVFGGAFGCTTRHDKKRKNDSISGVVRTLLDGVVFRVPPAGLLDIRILLSWIGQRRRRR